MNTVSKLVRPGGLRSLREQRGLTREDFVAEFERVARAAGYHDLSVSVRHLARWESSQPPQPRPRQAVVLRRMFGRPMSQLGFDSLDLGWTDPGDLHQWSSEATVADMATASSTESAGADHEFLTGAGLSAFGLGYLLAEPEPLALARSGRIRVDGEALAIVRRKLDNIMSIDTQLGSEGLAEAALEQISTVHQILRRRSYPDHVERELFWLAGYSSFVAGWLLFDAGKDHRGHALFRLGLRAARNADDDQLASAILALMSVQSYNCGQWADALTLVRLARRLVAGHSSPHVRATLWTREARAAAGLGDAEQAYRAVELALEHHAAGRGDDDPAFVDWVDLGELHGQAAGCAALLGQMDAAEDHMRIAREHYPRTANRSRSLHLLRLALGHAQRDNAAEAVEVAREGLSDGRGVSSFRFDEVKGDLALELTRQRSTPEVRALHDEYPELFENSYPRSQAAPAVHG